MIIKCILCGEEIKNFNELDKSILNYCQDCQQILIKRNLKPKKLTKQEKKKIKIKKIVRTLNKENENISYIWIKKNRPRGEIQKKLFNYLLDKYPEKILFPEVIESILADEILKVDKNGKERYLTFTKVNNYFKKLEEREIIKEIKI